VPSARRSLGGDPSPASATSRAVRRRRMNRRRVVYEAPMSLVAGRYAFGDPISARDLATEMAAARAVDRGAASRRIVPGSSGAHPPAHRRAYERDDRRGPARTARTPRHARGLQARSIWRFARGARSGAQPLLMRLPPAPRGRGVGGDARTFRRRGSSWRPGRPAAALVAPRGLRRRSRGDRLRSRAGHEGLGTPRARPGRGTRPCAR